MSGLTSGSLLYALLAVVLISRSVLSSDVNWGKKVSCFVVDETVVCPGCNYRAGLSCPRSLKNSQNCLLPSTTQPSFTTKPTSPPKTTLEEINATEIFQEEMNSTEKIFLDYNETSPEINEIQKESTDRPFDMAIYLYRLLGSDSRRRHRFNRDLQQQQQQQEQEDEEEEEGEEEPEICNWNGDCPCPLICCKTGPGCPKRCVMGIRLPPPWG